MDSNKFEDNAFIDKDSFIMNSSIGRYSTIGKNNHIFHSIIGNFVSVSWNVTVGAIGHEIRTLTTHSFPYSSAFNISNDDVLAKIPTTVGHDVWIGAGAIIMSGVTIGNGVIVGAGSIVTKDIEPYSVVAGNPSKLLYKRFNDNLILELEQMQWWNWKEDKLQKHIALFKEHLTVEIIDKINNS